MEYHLVSDNQNFRIKHSPLPLMNGDELVFHRSSEESVWKTIEKADMVIVADQVSVETLQTISIKARNGRLYYYAPESGDAGNYIAFGTPVAFGRNEDIFTDENIRRQELVRAALSESVPEEELAELEHIRWCRFYFLNYWKQGVPEKGARKDNDRRIHKDLVEYAALSQKEKDGDVVTMARNAGASGRQKSVVK